MNVSITVAYIETCISIILFILCFVTGLIYFIEHFCGKNSKDMKKLQLYFKIHTISTILFNILCSTFVMVYFIWIIIDPLTSNELYFLHKSHTIRIVITVLWYASKMFPFFIYNGRLKYAFKTGKYRTSKKLFATLNIIVIILTPLSLILGYLGVFIYDNPYLEWIGFNAYRIIYIILLLTLSWLFSKRMFVIIIQRIKLSENVSLNDVHNKPKYIKTNTHEDDDNTRETTKKCENQSVEINSKNNVYNSSYSTCTENEYDEEITEILKYLNVIVKSSLLLTFMIFSKILVMTVWFLHNYTLNSNHFSLTIGFLVMSLDSFVDEICVLLLYKFAQSYYVILCACSKDGNGQLNNTGQCGAHSSYTKCCTCLAMIYSNKFYSE